MTNDEFLRSLKRGVTLFEGLNLSNLVLYGVDLYRCTFKLCSLENASFINVNAANAVFYTISAFRATFDNVNFTGATLYGVNLSRCRLRDCRFGGGQLFNNVNLTGATLRHANLSCVTMDEVVFQNANIEDGVQLPLDVASRLSIVPDTGSFCAWKACEDELLVKLRVPERAARSNATSRKCRVSEAEVLSICTVDGQPRRLARSAYDNKFVYRVGETVKAKRWDPNRWNECSGGIHCFITKDEALAWMRETS